MRVTYSYRAAKLARDGDVLSAVVVEQSYMRRWAITVAGLADYRPKRCRSRNKGRATDCQQAVLNTMEPKG